MTQEESDRSIANPVVQIHCSVSYHPESALGAKLESIQRSTTMLKTRNPSTIAAPAAKYSHSVEVPPNARWLFTAGQVGVRPDGSIPEGFEAQHDRIWQNTLAILADAGMGAEDIVRLNVYSTDPNGLKYVMQHREKYLKAGHTPASTWVVVAALANPRWVVEMETVAAKV